jgi:hypothetical protein
LPIRLLVVTLTETPGARDTVRISYSAPYKVYTALLSQSGTSAPTAIVLENTLGVTPTLTYNNVGDYTIECTGCFTTDKTTVSTGYTDYTNLVSTAYILASEDGVNIQTLDISTFPTATQSNSILSYPTNSITIKVYY